MDSIIKISELSILSFAIVLIEGLVLSIVYKKYFNFRAMTASIICHIGWIFAFSFPFVGSYEELFYYFYKIRFFNFSSSNTTLFKTITIYALLFLSVDFCYYWLHRASHHIRWLWASHFPHHTPTEINLHVALRKGWFARHSGTYLFYLPLMLIGFHPKVMFVWVPIIISYQFLIHSSWIPKLGWLEFFLNTPSHHRMHHVKNLNTNFGGVLIIFDRIFGTFTAEENQQKYIYGLNEEFNSQNPLKIMFSEWIAMGKDFTQAQSVYEAIRCLFIKHKIQKIDTIQDDSRSGYQSLKQIG